MKKFYILLFAANLSFAQSSDLINTNRQVTKIVGELFPDQLSPPMPYQQITDFSTNPSQLNLSFFNTVSADVTYNGQNSFTVISKACTLGDYIDDNDQVNQFFGQLCNFFMKDSNYYYTIENNGTEKTLKIGNTIFQEIHFKSANLGTKDNELSKVVLGPNPVKNTLNITNSATISSVKIFDSSGKLVFDTQDEKSKTLNIDIRNYKTGSYIIQLNGKETYKIIKE